VWKRVEGLRFGRVEGLRVYQQPCSCTAASEGCPRIPANTTYERERERQQVTSPQSEREKQQVTSP